MSKQGEEQGYVEGIKVREKDGSFHNRSATGEGNRSLAFRNQGFRLLTLGFGREGDKDP